MWWLLLLLGSCSALQLLRPSVFESSLPALSRRTAAPHCAAASSGRQSPWDDLSSYNVGVWAGLCASTDPATAEPLGCVGHGAAHLPHPHLTHPTFLSSTGLCTSIDPATSEPLSSVSYTLTCRSGRAPLTFSLVAEITSEIVQLSAPDAADAAHPADADATPPNGDAAAAAAGASAGGASAGGASTNVLKTSVIGTSVIDEFELDATVDADLDASYSADHPNGLRFASLLSGVSSGGGVPPIGRLPGVVTRCSLSIRSRSRTRSACAACWRTIVRRRLSSASSC